MNLTSILSFFVLFGTSFSIIAQVPHLRIEKPNEAIVQSWKTGSETIHGQRIHLILSSANKSFQKKIIGKSGKKYILTIIHNPHHNLQLEHWQVKMAQIPCERIGTTVCPDLFSDAVIGSIKKDAYIGILYPEEEPFVYSINGEALWGEGSGFYWFKTVRKINIENFCVVIRVGDYKFNRKNKNRLDKFEVKIDFKSRCEPSESGH